MYVCTFARKCKWAACVIQEETRIQQAALANESLRESKLGH